MNFEVVTGDDLARVELTNPFPQLLLAACVPALSCARPEYLQPLSGRLSFVGALGSAGLFP